MWWTTLLASIGDVIGDLARGVLRFYAETEVGGTKRRFLIKPLIPNDLDTDGSGNSDLRIELVPTLLPRPGATIRFERRGAGVPDVSVLLYIGIDEGVFPVGTLPDRMRFAFFGFTASPGRVAPDSLAVTVYPSDRINAQLTAVGAGTALLLRGGLMTSPVAAQPAIGVPFGDPIRVGNIAASTDLLDARLSLALPSGGPLTFPEPLAVTLEPGATTVVEYTAADALNLAVDVRRRMSATAEQRVLATTTAMPAHFTASMSAAEAVVHPAAPVSFDIRGTGLPLPLSLTNATARLALPGTSLHVAWGPAPLLVEVTPDGPEAVSLNARLLPGPYDAATLDPPPSPRQAVVAEYTTGADLWASASDLRHLHVSRSATGVEGTITLADPPADVPWLAPRSLRATLRDATRVMADVRIGQIAANAADPHTGTLAATATVRGGGSIEATLSGRLRHLRALYDDGTARYEAWSPATPRKLAVTFQPGERTSLSVTPASGMAVSFDRRAGTGGMLAGFRRMFGHLLLNTAVRAHYAWVPRDPRLDGTADAGSSVGLHRDAAGISYPAEIIGMSLRYETGRNAGQTRTIRSMSPSELRTDWFEFTPAVGDKFVVVATDAQIDGTDALAVLATRPGLSASVSVATDSGRRMATRANPQVLQETSWTLDEALSPLPTGPVREAVAARVDGLRSVTLPPPRRPGRGPLAIDVELEPARPGRSFRYAENRRWRLPAPVTDALAVPADGRPEPHIRAVLTNPGDLFTLWQTVNAAETTYTLDRTGGDGGGWLWARTDQRRRTLRMAGLGIVSADLVTLPPRLALVLSDNLDEVRRHVAPNDVMWKRTSGWGPTSLQAVIPGGGDLRIERLVYATFTAGADSPFLAGVEGTYANPEKDEWSLVTATLLHLHDAAIDDQRITVWMLDGNNLFVPDRFTGLAIESAALTTDLDLDRYVEQLPVAVRRFDTISWHKQAEVQLKGYTGAWSLVSEEALPAIYERPAEEVGDWFLRAINRLLGGDAYFGNTPGDITGRGRPWP